MARRSGISLGMLGLVVLGGALGALLRALIVVPAGAAASALVVPLLTLVVNVVGSFALGLVVGWLDDRHVAWRTFLGTGVLGGFTTYSAFAVQTVQVGTSAPVTGLALAALAVFGGLVAAALGLRVGRTIAGVPGEVEPTEDAE